MTEKEYERKSVIDYEKYDILLNKFAKQFPREDILQINYYYDTEDYMFYHSGETLRVRQIENILQLQYKYNKNRAGNIRISDEYSEKTSALPKVITVNDVEVQNIGFMVTERRNFNIENCIVSLDKNYYSGIVDYEIEVETEKESDLPDILDEINFEAESNGKYSRYVENMLNRGFKYEIRK